MAAAPVYFTVAKMGYARLTTGSAVTDSTSGTTAVTWWNTAPTADWMLTKVVFSSTSATNVGNPADSLIFMFADDGSTGRLLRVIDIGDPAVGSTTAAGWQLEVTFGPEWVFPSTVLPEFQVSVTPTAGNIDVVVFAQSSQ